MVENSAQILANSATNIKGQILANSATNIKADGQNLAYSAIGFRGIVLCLLSFCLSSSGCGGGGKPDSEQKRSVPAVDMTVIVVDDPAIAEEIRKRWELEGDEDSDLTVRDVVGSDFFDDETSWTGDVLIYPSRDMGELTSRGWIEPISNKNLDSENLAWSSVFPLLRLRECNWGSETYGVTLGSPVAVLFYRHDLFEAAEMTPPKTWEEYAALVEHFNKRPGVFSRRREGGDATGDATESAGDVEPWSATMEPLAGNRAAHLLFARAAGYASHAGTLSVLFDANTMESRIASAPFQRAAQELRDAATTEALNTTNEQGLLAILQNRCAMSIGYLQSVEDADAESWERLSIAPLPGASECYDRRLGKWEPQADTPNSVVLLATRGRVVSIAKRTKSRVAAFRLLTRLAGIGWGDEVAPKSAHTTAYRSAHLGDTALWGPQGVPEGVVEQYLKIQRQQLAGKQSVVVPRVRGGRRLDEALADAIESIVKDEKPIDEALGEAANRWQAILDEELPTSAREEYLKSEGL